MFRRRVEGEKNKENIYLTIIYSLAPQCAVIEICGRHLGEEEWERDWDRELIYIICRHVFMIY